MIFIFPLLLSHVKAAPLPDRTPAITATIAPTKTIQVVYVYEEPEKNNTNNVLLIVALVVLSLILVSLIVVLIVACVKGNNGEIYTKTAGKRAPQMEAGAVEIRSIYSLKATQKQINEMRL